MMWANTVSCSSTPADIRLTAQAAGFRTFVRANIQLQVNLSTVIDVALEIGDLADRITITSEAPLLEAEKGDRGLVLNNKTVTELPLQGSRNPLTVAVLTPGAVFTAGLAVEPAGPFARRRIQLVHQRQPDEAGGVRAGRSAQQHRAHVGQ